MITLVRTRKGFESLLHTHGQRLQWDGGRGKYALVV